MSISSISDHIDYANNSVHYNCSISEGGAPGSAPVIRIITHGHT